MGASVSNGLLAGVDISPAMVAYVERRERRRTAQGGLVLKCAPAEALPFSDGSFTKLCSVNSIFYWEDAHRAFTECKRVATPGARLVLCFTDKASLEGKNFARYGLELYRAEDVVAMLGQAGFQEVQAVAGLDRHRHFWCITAII
jgi:ubiquinone/menaquinone biosynthesis C-methylase UbiE